MLINNRHARWGLGKSGLSYFSMHCLIRISRRNPFALQARSGPAPLPQTCRDAPKCPSACPCTLRGDSPAVRTRAARAALAPEDPREQYMNNI